MKKNKKAKVIRLNKNIDNHINIISKMLNLMLKRTHLNVSVFGE